MNLKRQRPYQKSRSGKENKEWSESSPALDGNGEYIGGDENGSTYKYASKSNGWRMSRSGENSNTIKSTVGPGVLAHKQYPWSFY